MDDGRRRRAYRRIVAEPLIQVGTVLERALEETRYRWLPAPLLAIRARVLVGQGIWYSSDGLDGTVRALRTGRQRPLKWR